MLERSQVVLSEAMSNVSAVAEESSATSEEVASLSNEQTNISEGLVHLSDKLETVSNASKKRYPFRMIPYEVCGPAQGVPAFLLCMCNEGEKEAGIASASCS